MGIIMPYRIIWSWYTDRWWVGCDIRYSEEGTGRGHSPPRPLFAVPNVTAHSSTASVPIIVLLYNGPLICGPNVSIKGWKMPSTGHRRCGPMEMYLVVCRKRSDKWRRVTNRLWTCGGSSSITECHVHLRNIQFLSTDRVSMASTGWKNKGRPVH